MDLNHVAQSLHFQKENGNELSLPFPVIRPEESLAMFFSS